MKFKNVKKSSQKNKKKIKSPKNSRIITDYFKFYLSKFNSANLAKVHKTTLKVFVVFIFMVAVIIVGLDLQGNIAEKKIIDAKRDELTKELMFWEEFIAKHEDYRDAYFRMSILEYQLGNKSQAKKHIQKGLSLDPNSENGRKIEEFLNK